MRVAPLWYAVAAPDASGMPRVIPVHHYTDTNSAPHVRDAPAFAEVDSLRTPINSASRGIALLLAVPAADPFLAHTRFEAELIFTRTRRTMRAVLLLLLAALAALAAAQTSCTTDPKGSLCPNYYPSTPTATEPASITSACTGSQTVQCLVDPCSIRPTVRSPFPSLLLAILGLRSLMFAALRSLPRASPPYARPATAAAAPPSGSTLTAPRPASPRPATRAHTPPSRSSHFSHGTQRSVRPRPGHRDHPVPRRQDHRRRRRVRGQGLRLPVGDHHLPRRLPRRPVHHRLHAWL